MMNKHHSTLVNRLASGGYLLLVITLVLTLAYFPIIGGAD